MAKVYVALILKGKRTFASVPARIQPEVRDMLLDLGRGELLDVREENL